jgi:hypothetical protein
MSVDANYHINNISYVLWFLHGAEQAGVHFEGVPAKRAFEAACDILNVCPCKCRATLDAPKTTDL